jgi:hypothetical protein
MIRVRPLVAGMSLWVLPPERMARGQSHISNGQCALWKRENWPMRVKMVNDEREGRTE